VVIGKDKTMRTVLASIPVILALLLWACPPVRAAPPARDSGSDGVEETIWALELAYFSNLYRADYAGVLALVDPRFLAWPGTSPQPIDRDGSARFMRELIAAPTTCQVRIERAGIRVAGDVALTAYVLHVDCAGGRASPRPSRITHTWVRQDAKWTLLGGMSQDQ
jgi:ketosteroid isomerase-like protein